MDSVGKGLVVLGLGYLGYRIMRSGMPKADATGVWTSADCSQWNVTSEQRSRELSEKVYEDMVQAGNDDPWDIADGVVRTVAPACHTSAQRMRTMAELNLYRNVFVETINRLLSRGRIDEPLYRVYKDEMETYLISEAEQMGGS